MTDWLTRPAAVGPSRWSFPPPTDWPDDDLVAIGADLESETIVAAYSRGIFPMVVDLPQPLLGWWSPSRRGVLPLEQLRVTRSMRQSARHFTVRLDTCFADVIRRCADPSREKGWITPDFIDAYVRLHELGWAHSVEVFDRAGELAGGLYGVRINGLFAGESMFYAQRDASKVALMSLVAAMQQSRMTLLDVQWCTPHLASLGAIELDRGAYLALLSEAIGSARPDGSPAISER